MASSAASLVLMAAGVADLEAKSLSELRALARQKGVRADTRRELVALLQMDAPTTNGAVTFVPSNGAPSSVGHFNARALQAMPLAQLRAIARSRGVVGMQRETIIDNLLRSGALNPPRTHSPAAPPPEIPAPVETEVPGAAISTPANVTAPVPVAAGSTITRQQLAAKSLPALRAYARIKGIAAANAMGKEQLISVLSGGEDKYGALATPRPVAAAVTATPAPALEPVPAPAPAASSPATNVDELSAMTMAQLRDLGKELGLRGDTKGELIKLILASSLAISASPAATPTPEPASSDSSKPIAATALQEVVQTLEEALGSSTTVLPPFESDIPEGGTTALEPVKLASEVTALKEALSDIQARDLAREAERDSLIEQANFLRNVLVGGIGLAVVPLILPFQIPVTSTLTSSSLAPASPPTETLLTPPPPEPVVREVSPDEFCATIPSALLTPQAAKFCNALLEP